MEARQNLLERKAILQICRPVQSDIEQISGILHAEGHFLSDKMIESKINNLFVLVYAEKIIAVMDATVDLKKVKQDWVAVHPMFPEKFTAAAVYNAISAISHKLIDL